MPKAATQPPDPEPTPEDYSDAQLLMWERISELRDDIDNECEAMTADAAEETHRSYLLLFLLGAAVSEALRIRLMADLEQRLTHRFGAIVGSAIEDTQAIVREEVLAAVGGRLRRPGVVPRPSLGKWAPLVRGHVADAIHDLGRVVKAALFDRLSPEAFRVGISRYLTEKVALRTAFAVEKESALDKLIQQSAGAVGGAQQLYDRAVRLAKHEAQQARLDLEVALMKQDPYVKALQWTRRTGYLACACELLATQDAYGLGRGIYPVSRFPTAPHPGCLCGIMPVMVFTAIPAGKKPNPALQLDPRTAPLPASMANTTAARQRATREAAARALGLHLPRPVSLRIVGH